ncbi:DJ-1 protein, partial [Schizopora paradoxa]
MPSALIFIADGTEEMEFTITYDTLVRAGIKCTSAFVGEATSKFATCSRGVKIVPDASLEEIHEDHDILIVPGGAKGADTISKSTRVQELLKKQHDKGKFVGMICAGGLAAKTSAFPKLSLTSHPSVKGELETEFDYKEDAVVVNSGLITSRGPGTTFPFALKIVELLCGKEKRNEVQGPMVFPPGSI